MNNLIYTIDYPKREINLQGIEFHVTDKCNLNCAGCAHFCPLIENDNSDSVNNTMKSLWYLHNKGVRWYYLCLIGGEPTLNVPRMTEYIQRIRKELFWTRHILINTNGSLLHKLPDDFLRLCAEQPKLLGGNRKDVKFLISEYPGIPKENYEKGYKRLEEFGVQYEIQAVRPEFLNWQLTPQENNVNTIKNTCTDCDNLCIHLRHNRLYFCATVAFAEEWNKKFPQYAIPTFDQHKSQYPDYLTIDKELTFERICQYFTSGMGTSFCNHCKQHGEKYFKWHISEKKAEEWIYAPDYKDPYAIEQKCEECVSEL